MRTLVLFSAAVLAATVASAAQAPAIKKAPTQLSVIACRVDDWTGKRPLPEGVRPSKDWRDLEWHRDAEFALECKRIALQLEDAVAMNYSNKEAAALHPDWSDAGQCSARSMDLAPRWSAQNPGYWPLAIGCPTPIADDNGTPDDKSDDVIIDYKMPECPMYEPGKDGKRMHCKFDESMI
jgi:hypothetical protein